MYMDSNTDLEVIVDCFSPLLLLGSEVHCTDTTYRCKNNKCISKVNPECDGKKDCEDGSDEENCGRSQEKLFLISICTVELV